MNSKSLLRKSMLEKREAFKDDLLEGYNKIIFNKITENQDFIKAKNIFIFVSFNKEVDTHKIIENSLALGKNVYVPRIISKEQGMVAIGIKGMDELKPNKFGILEPDYEESKIIRSELIDLVIVPGLAFDIKGGRIGYGAGYYDRFLKNTNNQCKKIGIGYDFQIIERVPMDERDVYLDYTITN